MTIKRERIIVFIQTDFPDPVVPAINRWGIEDKSPNYWSSRNIFS